MGPPSYMRSFVDRNVVMRRIPVLFFITSHSVLRRTRIVLDKRCRENQNTQFITRIFFRKSYRLWDNVEILCRAGQATDDNMAHAHCTLDNWGYGRTLTICNTSCFARKQWLCERASVLRYTYIFCLVSSLYFRSILPLCCVLVFHVFNDELAHRFADYTAGVTDKRCASGRRWNCSSNLPVQIIFVVYRVIHKSLRDFRTRLRNNQDRHDRKEHINR